MQFSQLEDKAKQRAIEWYRGVQDLDWQCSHYLGEISTILGAFGFEPEDQEVKTRSGKTYHEPIFHWQLAYCQGDHFKFAGRWRAEDVDTGKLLEEYPQWKELHALVPQCAAILLRYPTGRAYVNMTWGMGFEVINGESASWGNYEDDDPHYMDDDAIADLDKLVQALNSLAYDHIRSAHEFDMGEEAIIEGIEANEYEFDECGVVV